LKIRFVSNYLKLISNGKQYHKKKTQLNQR